MIKYGRDALLIAMITGTFTTLAVLLKMINPYAAIGVFILSVIFIYVAITKYSTKVARESMKPENHPVFFTIDNSISVAIKCLSVKHEKKRKLIEMYIKAKFGMVRSILMDTITSNDINGLPRKIMNVMDNVEEELSGRAPKVFLDKMMEWDNKYNSWTMEAMGQIIGSAFYCDDQMKICACFDCVQVMLKSTFVALENTVSQINGDLEVYLDSLGDTH